MARLFDDDKLLLASNNQGKLKELANLFSSHKLELISAGNIEEPEETGVTFEENAILKARYYGGISGIAALADDSGLCVDELGGVPGVYSARWAGEKKDFTVAMKKVESELKLLGKTTSDAQFICALALWWPDGHIECFTGKLSGTISFPARGPNGFGYDPIFIPHGYENTLGELSPQIKYAISHRTNAFNQLIANCFKT